ncbi:MAG TPA: alkaline phosphatase family protein [Opitutales bacterium]|nr:alkaline phosphatase family protein [Opitutales bacterium]
MPRIAVLNVVGLTERLLHSGRLPRLAAFAEKHGQRRVRPAFPAVTCTAQAAYLTGRLPREHGIVANGWHDRDLAEHQFWKQSNRLVQAPKIWHALQTVQPGATVAQLFWWFNMHADVDFSITPRPLYPADGRKVFDIHTQPMGLREELKAALGEFPFPQFWGPAAGRPSSDWIAASARWVEQRHAPTLNLIYLPHLDYALQKLGPDPVQPRVAAALAEIDEIAGGLAEFFAQRGVRVIMLSEYGITPVSRPVHLNRVLRSRGWLSIKNELGRETLDQGGSAAFAIADHQIAHIYVRSPELRPAVRAALAATPGVERVLNAEELRAAGLDHPRSGDLLAVAAPDAWFTYYYWEDDARAPDFARTIDIHRKPGYDPCELFLDPALRAPKLKILAKLLKKKLGFRMLMDVIPLDATLVRGSHGRVPEDPLDWPVLLGCVAANDAPLAATGVYHELGGALGL